MVGQLFSGKYSNVALPFNTKFVPVIMGYTVYIITGSLLKDVVQSNA